MKKNKYDLYPFIIDLIKRQLKRSYGMKRVTDEEAVRVFSNEPNFLQSRAAVIAEEYKWRTSERPILFPQSGDVLEGIRKTKFKVSMVSGIKAPFGNFLLAIPQGYKIDGVNIPSCMITALSTDQRVGMLHKVLDLVYNKRPLFDGKAEEFIGIQYEHSNAPYRVCVPYRLLAAALDTKTPDELDQLLGTIPGEYKATEEQQKLQFHMIRLVCSLFVYCQATTGSIVKCFPAPNRPNIEGKNFKRAQDFTLGLSAKNREGTTPTGHYRSGHYRQLINEKYYKGEHANKEIGTRFVWVKDTFVGTNIDPHTLKRGSKK